MITAIQEHGPDKFSLVFSVAVRDNFLEILGTECTKLRLTGRWINTCLELQWLQTS